MNAKEIIKGIKNDSGSVWKHLLSISSGSMGRQIRPILKNVHDVTFDDVFEEACIILMENVKAGKLDEGETNLEGYLYVICKRIALRYAGKKRADSIDSGELIIKDSVEEDIIGTPEEEAGDDAEVSDFFDRVLKAMPSNQSAVMRHFYWDRMSMSEIAALCGFKNENVAKSLKKRYMDNFISLAKQMLKDDEAAEAAIERTIERAALRDQLDECRHLESGVLAASACKEGKGMPGDKEIVDGIRDNSPVAWKALYATCFDSLKKKISPILK